MIMCKWGTQSKWDGLPENVVPIFAWKQNVSSNPLVWLIRSPNLCWLIRILILVAYVSSVCMYMHIYIYTYFYTWAEKAIYETYMQCIPPISWLVPYQHVVFLLPSWSMSRPSVVHRRGCKLSNVVVDLDLIYHVTICFRNMSIDIWLTNLYIIYI